MEYSGPDRQPHAITAGGAIDWRALVGGEPEYRDWTPGDPFYWPQIAPSARIGAFVTVDCGIRSRTRVGDRTWIMKHVHLGHDVIVGSDCELSPGVVIGGFVMIGDNTRIGIGAVVLPEVVIGSGCRIGAGAVVTKNVPPNQCWVGNPAKFLREEHH